MFSLNNNSFKVTLEDIDYTHLRQNDLITVHILDDFYINISIQNNSNIVIQFNINVHNYNITGQWFLWIKHRVSNWSDIIYKTPNINMHNFSSSSVEIPDLYYYNLRKLRFQFEFIDQDNSTTDS